MSDGRDIPDLQDVKFTDPSEVDQEVSSPKVTITNSVLKGLDAKACSSSAAVDYLEDYAESNITYCFVVKVRYLIRAALLNLAISILT
jgi:hypothetical protein